MPNGLFGSGWFTLWACVLVSAPVHAEDGEVREKVWNGMVEAERNGDPDKKGQAILARITRAEQLNGKPLSEIGAG